VLSLGTGGRTRLVKVPNYAQAFDPDSIGTVRVMGLPYIKALGNFHTARHSKSRGLRRSCMQDRKQSYFSVVDEENHKNITKFVQLYVAVVAMSLL
jgi:hypothetical protein